MSLVDKQFGSKADKIYCGNCYDAQFASRCDGCGEIFRAGKSNSVNKDSHTLGGGRKASDAVIAGMNLIWNNYLVAMWAVIDS